MKKDIGLTEQQVEYSRATHGWNVLAPAPHRPAWKLALEKFSEPLILILAFAALLAVLTGGWVEGGGILLAILLSAGIGFLSEHRAGREFDILNRTDDAALVRTWRNGSPVHCPKAEIVVGDAVAVETGEEIPADGIVVESRDLRVDQSKFTGEPEPVAKVTPDDPAKNLLARNATYPPECVLRGSTVVSGCAVIEITAVGMATEIGKTAAAATEITDETTPLQKQLRHLSKVIAIFGFSLSALLFVLLTAQAFSADALTPSALLTIFMIAVTLIVVTVPEGLPMSITLGLACNMRKMAQSNCLIRRLHAGETIGCATVICTDKTGTLTMNQMNVTEVFFQDFGRDLFEEAMCVNSTAELNGGEVLGNPTEGALLRHLANGGIDYRRIRGAANVAKQWNFTTETKYMATLLDSGRLHLKGAPEVVLGKCALIPEKSGIRPLTPETRRRLLEAFKAEQDNGRRTLAFAFSAHGANPENADDLVYLGFVAISDPVRPEVTDAVKACRQAGIKVKIVTGDTAATAAGIARQIGLPEGRVVEGREFEALDQVATMGCAKTLSVIARARPGDKMKLVKTLQQQFEVVAVTGDGTNDAPALHHADVGIAMGKTGTAIAREASDIILLDDSFRSIVNAVLWGRSLYLNIQRFLVFQLTINVAAAGIALAGPLMGAAMPFTVIQMLWINLIMDTLAALALATEPPTPDVMNRPPRSPRAFIVTKPMALEIAGTAALFIVTFFAMSLYWQASGGMDERRLTILFTAFVMLQIWNLLNVRAFGTCKSMIADPPYNPLFPWIVLGIAGVQILITQFGGKLFRTVPLNLADWIWIIGLTSLVFLSGELRRWHENRKTGATAGNRG